MAGAQSPVLALDPAREAIEPQVLWAAVTDGQATIDDAVRGKLPLRARPASTIFDLGPRNALWLQVRLQPSAAQPWVLEFPLPTLDAVTVYQQDAAGRWVAQRAGDRVPMREWPEAGRYPFFRLQPAPGKVTELYVQVRYPIPLALPMRVVTLNAHDYRTQLEFLGLGMALGALAWMVAGALFRAWTLRDKAYGLFAAHALVSGFAVAAFTGVAGQWLWPGAGVWIDAAPGCLALLASSIALMIVEKLAALEKRTRAFGKLVHSIAYAGPLLAALYPFFDRRGGVAMLGSYVFVVAVLALAAATMTVRRGDPVGRWMLLGTVPLALSVLLAVGRVFNWVESSWVTEYAVVMALTFDLPTLQAALNSRSSERRSAQLRQLASARQDPLTGLLKGGPFLARVAQAIERWQKRGEGAAVAVIELANHRLIKDNLGAEQAEESLLRGVIKLRNLVRDVDTTGRLGEARFGLVLEGLGSREAVRDMATRLIAWGLMPDEENPGAPILQFHIAALLVEDLRGEDPMAALLGTLRAMSPGTRRPFRLVDPHDVPQDSRVSDPHEPAPTV